jgi:hypothetical protein
MVIVQIVISVPGDNKNRIEVNILEREDANAPERELAQNIQELHRVILEEIAAQLPEGDVTLTVIDHEPSE